MVERNFQIGGDGLPVTATAASQRVEIPANTRDVMFFNPGPRRIRVRVGDRNVVATAASMSIVAGEKGTYGVGYGATHLAVISPDGDQQVEIFFGEGS